MSDVLEKDKVVWVLNPAAREPGAGKASTGLFSSEAVTRVRSFHRTLPRYRPTPLARLDQLAGLLGLGGLRVKDESYRLGLNAFKATGAVYALGVALAQRLGLDGEHLSFEEFKDPRVRERASEVTFVTATDGNHGRAVAWAAQQIGCRAVVYMPKGSSPARLEHIRALGAQADIIDGNYDDAVRLAAEQALANGWLLSQDTAWAGYEDFPRSVMQGYATLMDEAFEQLDGVIPSHVFVQCGVGSFSSACQGYLVERFGPDRPRVVVVEPTKAACFYQSMIAPGPDPVAVTGDLDTIMAGLACGEPNILGWEILRDHADAFVACPDDVAERGCRILGNPLAGDDRVISGESGSVTSGLLFDLMKEPEYASLRDALALNNDAVVLLISTEGDTDPDAYRKIVWGVGHL